VFARVQKFIGATEDLLEIFNEPVEEVEEIESLPAEQILHGSIRFNNLSFSYPTRTETEVLHKISVAIKPDTLVALVGPSGAGKSTFVSLLLRLYNPTSGQILFDEKESLSIPISALRSQMAIVPQDIFLFGGTIRENIAYGKTGASDEMIVEAARKANAWEFISQFPEGFETLVGERGTQLSGGQRQRIAIARAVLKDPKILILDEATSSLDSESERLVQDALEKLMKGRTSIVIAHRLSTIRQADNILVMDSGRIIEQGTHDQLLRVENGVYRNLSELQFAG
jgi:ABC-type multidrug transport system fused ATPase/permease subunit